jgi:hypothetical protein
MSPGPGNSMLGMGKLLQDGDADIVIAATYLLDYRLQRLTALLPVGNEPILVYFLQPQASSVQNIYNLPFSRNTWLAVFFMVALLFVSSIIFTNCGAGLHSDRNWLSSLNIFWIICIGCQKRTIKVLNI